MDDPTDRQRTTAKKPGLQATPIFDVIKTINKQGGSSPKYSCNRQLRAQKVFDAHASRRARVGHPSAVTVEHEKCSSGLLVEITLWK